MYYNEETRGYLTVLTGKKTMTDIVLDTRRLRVGSFIKRSYFEPFQFDLPFVINKPKNMTWSELEEDMTSWLLHDVDKRLILESIPNRFYMARIIGIDVSDRTRNNAEGSIDVYCQIPFKHSFDKTIDVTPKLNTFNIGGQVPTNWISKTTFKEGTKQYILENDNGGKITLNYSFFAGDVLEINYRTRSIKLNGRDLIVALSLDSSWFQLPNGNVKLKATHETKITYNELYY
ncbi:hypothetical protein J8TS2_35660 [Lederbergia ruris]|uniref:Siphovirus-type tail component C-terminal domain-containing protein n=1 Tax=Lederbergia ruris TaxID=217495 RepID=A0ABQ4KMT7_9BACI|nr:distal tail protein Dit [Lederbergia ruris]GIN59247.1 hypothetical protein J8TS2_35660 [Lederbergia ruris]